MTSAWNLAIARDEAGPGIHAATGTTGWFKPPKEQTARPSRRFCTFQELFQ